MRARVRTCEWLHGCVRLRVLYGCACGARLRAGCVVSASLTPGGVRLVAHGHHELQEDEETVENLQAERKGADPILHFGHGFRNEAASIVVVLQEHNDDEVESEVEQSH